MNQPKKPKTVRRTAEVIVHPATRMAERISEIGKQPLKQILLIIDEISANEGNIAALIKILLASQWAPEPTEIDFFAAYLVGHRICHSKSKASEPSIEEGQSEVLHVEQHHDEVRQHLRAAQRIFEEAVKETDELLGARGLVTLIDELCGHHNPLPIIQRYKKLYFDGAEERGEDKRPLLSATSAKAKALQIIAQAFRNLMPNDRRSRAFAYWFSDPNGQHPEYRVTFLELQKVAKCGEEYRILVFDRLLANGMDGETSPKLRNPKQWCWVIDQAETAPSIVSVLKAIFAENENWTINQKDSTDSLVASVSGLVSRMEKVQHAFGGRAFLNVASSDGLVALTLAYWLPRGKRPVIDFPSTFAGCLYDEEVDLPLWEECIDRAIDLGHVELAQAMGSFALLHLAIRGKGEISWEPVIRILKRLYEWPASGALAESARVAHQVLKEVHDAPIFAARLEAFLSAEPRLASVDSSRGIRLVSEAYSHPSKDEVVARLVEHIGVEGWNKLPADAQGWFVEGDLNWSLWRFPNNNQSKDRKDWAPIANQFSKAIERVLTKRFQALCREHGICKEYQAATLGNVVKLLKDAGSENSSIAARVTELTGRAVDQGLVARLSEFTNKHRNASAHPGPYDLDKLDSLRRELFTRGLLKQITEQLL